MASTSAPLELSELLQRVPSKVPADVITPEALLQHTRKVMQMTQHRLVQIQCQYEQVVC